MGVRGSQRARGRGKSSKGTAFAAGKRERERERRETYPLSHCVAQPNPNQATRGRDSSATSSPRAYLSWSCSPSVLRSRIPQQQAVSPGRGLVLGLGLGLSFLLLVFLRLLPVAHDLRHATTLVSRLHFFLSLLPSFYEVDSTKKKKVSGIYIRKYEEKNSVASGVGGEGNLKPRETHTEKRQK